MLNKKIRGLLLVGFVAVASVQAATDDLSLLQKELVADGCRGEKVEAAPTVDELVKGLCDDAKFALGVYGAAWRAWYTPLSTTDKTTSDGTNITSYREEIRTDFAARGDVAHDIKAAEHVALLSEMGKRGESATIKLVNMILNRIGEDDVVESLRSKLIGVSSTLTPVTLPMVMAIANHVKQLVAAGVVWPSNSLEGVDWNGSGKNLDDSMLRMILDASKHMGTSDVPLTAESVDWFVKARK